MLILVYKKDFYKFQKYALRKGYGWIRSGKNEISLDEKPYFYNRCDRALFWLGDKTISWWGNNLQCSNVFINKLDLE